MAEQLTKQQQQMVEIQVGNVQEEQTRTRTRTRRADAGDGDTPVIPRELTKKISKMNVEVPKEEYQNPEVLRTMFAESYIADKFKDFGSPEDMYNILLPYLNQSQIKKDRIHE